MDDEFYVGEYNEAGQYHGEGELAVGDHTMQRPIKGMVSIPDTAH